MTVYHAKTYPDLPTWLAAGVKGGEKGLLKKSAEVGVEGTGSGGATEIRV